MEALAPTIVQALRRKRAETERARAQEVIQLQARELLDVSMPAIEVLEGMVLVPLVGTLDTMRAQKMIERLLARIAESGARIAILDITGVPAMDTMTARNLIEAINASRLLGAEVILTGVRPSIAQTLVHLGVDLGGVVTRSSLSSGIHFALERMGLTIATRTQARG